MANSATQYIGNGTTTAFSIGLTLSYLRESHIKVFLDEVETTAFSLINADQNGKFQSVQLNTAPAQNVVVLVRRITQTTLIHDYQDGALILEEHLDESNLQALMLAEEAQDGFFDEARASDLNMGGNRVINTIYGVEPTDGVTLAQAQEIAAQAAGVGVVPQVQPRQQGDGVTTTFSTPATTQQLAQSFFINLDGISQRPYTDYTISVDGTVTFKDGSGNDEAVAAGVDIDVVFFEPVSLANVLYSGAAVETFMASAGNSAVTNMLESETQLGGRYSTGGSVWEKVFTANGNIADFELLTDLYASDFGVYGIGDDTLGLQLIASSLTLLDVAVTIKLTADAYTSTAGTTFTTPVIIECGTGAKFSITNTLDYLFEFEDTAYVTEMHCDFNDNDVAGRAPLIFHKPFTLDNCSVENILGLDATYEQYAVHINPFDGDANIKESKFSRVRNSMGSVGSSNRWAGFIFVYGEASNVTEGFHLKLGDNTYDHCETLFPAGFTEAQKESFMDADAIRIFYENPTTEIKDRSKMTSTGNTFTRCQKRFYKPNSTECIIRGDRAVEATRAVGTPGMSHVIQLRGGASVDMKDCFYNIDLRNYPVVQYEMYRDLIISDVVVKNTTLSTSASRLFFVLSDGTLNTSAQVKVSRVEMEGFYMLFSQSGDNNPFLDIVAVKVKGARRLTNYEHTGSAGYSLTDVTAQLDVPDARTVDTSICDRATTTDSTHGARFKNVELIETRTRLEGFGQSVDVRSGVVTADNLKVYQTTGDISSTMDFRLCTNLKLINCAARSTTVNSNLKVYIANHLGALNNSGNSTEEIFNTQPWYGTL